MSKKKSKAADNSSKTMGDLYESIKSRSSDKSKTTDGVVKSDKTDKKDNAALERLHSLDKYVDKFADGFESFGKFVKRLPKKQILIGVGLIALVIGFPALLNSIVPEEEEPQVAAVVDTPFDQRRTNDLKRLAAAVELYFEDNQELPSHEILASEVFINQYLGELDYPGEGDYEFGVYSTKPYIIGYALNTVCNEEGNGTTPSQTGGYFTLHIVLDTEEGRQFYCLDNA